MSRNSRKPALCKNPERSGRRRVCECGERLRKKRRATSVAARMIS
ncbi:hypothetical protein TcasGA2_TC006480 [Tribolium castaneum]|uniref:Uncharacterized protein n=1 Tax=Tribolium castaneum TaxID=7070 RepID=D6WX41_TRICA|nr:hypothetical protein TcasGA2_TC006480 [Tribolium castaneum]